MIEKIAVNVAQEELWALSALTSNTQNAQNELQRLVLARQALIKLLEDKYKATFEQATGQFIEKTKSSEIKE